VTRDPIPPKGEQSPEKPTLGKRLFQIGQILLALVLIAVILFCVRIFDTLLLPEGAAFAGEHSGRIERKGEVVLFVSDAGGFSAEAVYEGEILTTLTIVGKDGATEEIPHPLIGGVEIKEGLVNILKRTDPGLYVRAFLIFLLAYACGFLRWKLLLDAAGLPITLRRTTRLSAIGLFFNNIVPAGLTGGDLVKAYYIARHYPEKKTDAVITVLIDRVMGVVVLATFSAVAVLSDLNRYDEVAIYIYGFLLIAFTGAVIFFSSRLRRLLFVDAIIRVLPFADLIRKIDRSVFLYRYRKRAILLCVLLTAGVHTFVILTVWTLAQGLSIDCSLVDCAILVPIILIVSALPITPAGWGVGEYGFIYFFGFAGVAAGPALALSFIHRFNTLLISLSGGVFLLADRFRPARSEAGETTAETAQQTRKETEE
jgi:glycosyltransferase 2 family protein